MRKQLLSDGLVLAIVAAMVGAAELTGQSEIIFPEITAIAVGAFLSPRLAWRTDRVRVLVTVSLCAVLGVLLVRYVPLPVWGRLTLAYGLAQVVFLLSGTRFAPMISAIALPVLLGTAAMIAILRSLGMYVPPAGALAILPMLLPAERLPRYPLQIALGTALFLALALVLFRAPRESHAER